MRVAVVPYESQDQLEKDMARHLKDLGIRATQ